MEKRFKNGFCVGKFMPMHNGHVYMIEEGASVCETMHVLVCTRDVEPIEGNLRYQWAKKIFKDRDDVVIHWCHEELPQYPEDDPNFWQIWHDTCYRYVPEIDAVFASEEYVYPFAECLGVAPILVDMDRETVPVSGTAIRENPFDNWRYIPHEVKPYFTKTIAIVGPESTGKSTLTRKLGRYYMSEMINEYGREYTDITPTNDLVSEDFINIAREHWRRVVDKQVNSRSRLLFLDTEAIITKTFGEMYLGKEFSYDAKEVLDMMIRHQTKSIAHYLLLYPDIEWEDDGTRDFGKEEDRKKHYRLIKEYLDKLELPYSIIKGSGEDRTIKAIREIEKNITGE